MTLSNDADPGYGDSVPSIDEGWWQSVLAEEMRQYHAPIKPALASQHKAAIQLEPNTARQTESLAKSPASNHSGPSRITTPASA